MNFLDVNKKNKKNIVDTIAAVYILEIYLGKEQKKQLQKLQKQYMIRKIENNNIKISKGE